jgi:hypothetical protein
MVDLGPASEKINGRQKRGLLSEPLPYRVDRFQLRSSDSSLLKNKMTINPVDPDEKK